MQDGGPITRAHLKEGAEGVGPLAGNEVHARFETEHGVPLFFESVANAGAKTAGFGLQLIGANGIIDLRMDSTPIAHLLAGSPFQPVPEPRAWVPITTAGVGQPEPIADVKDQVMQHLLPAGFRITAPQWPAHRLPADDTREPAVGAVIVCLSSSGPS